MQELTNITSGTKTNNMLLPYRCVKLLLVPREDLSKGSSDAIMIALLEVVCAFCFVCLKKTGDANIIHCLLRLQTPTYCHRTKPP